MTPAREWAHRIHPHGSTAVEIIAAAVAEAIEACASVVPKHCKCDDAWDEDQHQFTCPVAIEQAIRALLP